MTGCWRRPFGRDVIVLIAIRSEKWRHLATMQSTYTLPCVRISLCVHSEYVNTSPHNSDKFGELVRDRRTVFTPTNVY
jgi:hypothetical protein